MSVAPLGTSQVGRPLAQVLHIYCDTILALFLLQEQHWTYLFLLVYVIFAAFGMLNLVTAVFVDALVIH